MRGPGEPSPRVETTTPDAGPSVPGETPEPPAATGTRAAWMVGGGIFLSRIAGLVRESVFGFFFGLSPVADVFRVALRTPNVIQNLLGEGTLSASMIPVYAGFLERGREEDGGRFAGAALGILATVAYGGALVGILLAGVLVPVVFFGWEPWQQDLMVRLIRILFVMTATLSVSAWALGILNSHGRFFVSYVAPVAWNLAFIVTMVVFGGLRGWEPERLVVALAWAGLAGGVLQLLVQLPFLVPVLKGFRISLSRRVEGVREAIHNFWPVVTARGVVNMSSLLDLWLATFLADGAAAALGYSQTFYLLPISLFGMAIAASELPALSRQGVGQTAALVPRVRVSLERLAFLLVPSALAFLVLGDVFVAGFYERGLFPRDGTTLVYAVLAAYALGLVASASSRLLSSTFYALRDTRTPARVAYLRIAVSVAVGAALMLPADRLSVGSFSFGATGLALGATVGAWLEYALLRRSLTRAIGAHGPAPGRLARIGVAGVVAALVGAGAKLVLGSAVPAHDGWVHGLLASSPGLVHPVLAVGTALTFGVAYLAVAGALGVGMPVGRILRRG